MLVRKHSVQSVGGNGRDGGWGGGRCLEPVLSSLLCRGTWFVKFSTTFLTLSDFIDAPSVSGAAYFTVHGQEM